MLGTPEIVSVGGISISASPCSQTLTTTSRRPGSSRAASRTAACDSGEPS